MGQHISDLRSQLPGGEDVPLFVLELERLEHDRGSRRIERSEVSGVYLFWNSSWPQQARTATMDNVLKSFLANEAALGR